MFRQFSLADLPRIMEIERSSFTVEAFRRSQFKKIFKENTEGFFVAEISGKVVGYVVGSISDRTGELDSLAVDPHYRGHRIGKKLVELIVDGWRERGIKRCLLRVRTTNDSAIEFYKRLGFQVVKTVKSYYDDDVEAYVMRKAL